MKSHSVFVIGAVLALWLNGFFVCVDSTKESRDVYSGSCGTNLNWTLDSSSGSLTINGSGDMTAFTSSNEVPWHQYSMLIKSVTFKGALTSIASYAFSHCSSLSSITIPLTVASLGLHSFIGCKSLTSLFIPASVKSVPSYSLFYGCTKLSAITVDESNTALKDINGVLFNKAGTTLYTYPAGKLGGYEIPSSVITIVNYAFHDAANLSSLVIPDSVVSIGLFAFASCSSLTHVTIPASVTSIGDAPFKSCTSLSYIEVDENNTKFKSEDGVLFNKEGTVLRQYPGAKKGGYRISDGVKTIARESFSNSGGLTSVSIPASVKSIGHYAFEFSKKLEVVSFFGSAEMSQVNDRILSGCPKLRVICVPDRYSSSTFCGRTDYCKRASCELQDVENHCFYAQCQNDTWQSFKRENATAWENRTNGCVQYQCDNSKGAVSKSKCMSTAEAKSRCVENECVTDEKKPDSEFVVSIPIDDKEGLMETNTTTIENVICNLTGFDNCGSFVVELELDENGHILSVVVYINDEESAKLIVSSVNSIDKGVNCTFGVLCLSSNATLTDPHQVSASARTLDSIVMLYLFITLTTTIAMRL